MRLPNHELEQAVFAACGQAQVAPSARELADELAKLGIIKSERQLRRYLDKWELLSEQDKMPYRLFYWPESFPVALPWEAAPTIRPLLADWLSRGRRPVIRLVTWYWKVSLFVPHLNHESRAAHALALAVGELSTPANHRRMNRSTERQLLRLPEVDEEPMDQDPAGREAAFTALLFGVEIHKGDDDEPQG